MEPPPPQQLRLRVLDTVRLSPPPSPSHHDPEPFPLSGLDADRNVLDVTFRTLRFFPPPLPPSTDPHAVLPRAFQAALALFPALAGRLRLHDDGHHHVVVVVGAGAAVPVVLAESGLSAADVDTDCPGSPLLDLLAPPDSDTPAAALALQVTRFACGGVALGMRVAHALCDGAGATKFLAAAARFARGLQGSSPEPAAPPVWQRRELLGPRRPPRVTTQVFDRVLALDGGRGPYGSEREQLTSTTRECFHVSGARVEALRARIADEAGVKLTTFEVAAAFIWRARVRANRTTSRSGDGEVVVKMVYSMNISRLVSPPLPDGYWGNVCVPVYVALAAGDLATQPLAATAAMVRGSKRGVDDEYVRSYVDFQELHRRRRRRDGVGVTAGGGGAAVSAFTDWRRLGGHGEVDFGWGGPESVLPLSWRILGSTEPCFLLPYGVRDERRRGGFKVAVVLKQAAVGAFREEMQELLLQPQTQQQSSAGKL